MKWQTNDAKQYRLNPNCFEKTKVRWGIFKKLSTTKLHSEQSAPLAANGLRIKNRFNVFYTLLPAGAVI